jgi:hypothetical protein
MKKSIVLALFAVLCASTSLFAQQDTMHTLIKISKPKYIGFYVSPEYQYGQTGGAFNSFAGSSAMFIVNKKLALGVTAATNIQENFSPSSVSPLLLRSTFGGAKIEYTPRPNAAVHLTFPLVIGMGVAQADSATYVGSVKNGNNGGGKDHNGKDNFPGGQNGNNERGISADYFVVQPGVQLEANLARFVKLYAGVNYRVGFGTETIASPLSKTTMTGVSANVGLKVGLFDLYTENWHLPHFRMSKHKRERN